MTREILFRAKRVDNGEWVEGYLWIGNNSAYITPWNLGISYSENHVSAFAHEIDQETICQYTGLHDKNGKEIYEGDIISFSHSKYKRSNKDELWGGLGETEEYTRNYAVEFVNTYCTYGLRARNESIHFVLKQATINTHDVKVIGNIYDNPELLKEDAENANTANQEKMV